MSDRNESVALVTGASSGIGRAAALAFAARGDRVVAADVQTEAGERVVGEIRDRGGEAVFIRANVSDAAEVAGLLATLARTYGRLDHAFNNAGIEGEMAPTDQCTEQNWDRTIAVNLKGIWLCMKHEIPLLRRRTGGAIVNCSSVAGLVGFAGLPAYVASKHAIVGLTRAAALEYARDGLRINAVCPGVIRTPMVDRLLAGDPGMEAKLTAAEPIGRFGQPEEIAAAVVWLCSEAASFITGQAIAIDGGWVAQ